MKLTEVEMLKYWLDAEVSIIHILIYAVMWLVTDSFVFHLILAGLILYSAIYAVIRIAKISSQDPNYLKINK